MRGLELIFWALGADGSGGEAAGRGQDVSGLAQEKGESSAENPQSGAYRLGPQAAAGGFLL